jgi:hypothetical protein
MTIDKSPYLEKMATVEEVVRVVDPPMPQVV